MKQTTKIYTTKELSDLRQRLQAIFKSNSMSYNEACKAMNINPETLTEFLAGTCTNDRRVQRIEKFIVSQENKFSLIHMH
jgi:predicted transcriptional regulator